MNDGVVATLAGASLESRSVVLHLRSPSDALLAMIETPRTIDEIVRELQTTYDDTDLATLRADVGATLRSWQEMSFVCERP